MGVDRLPTWSTYIYDHAGDPASRVLVAVTDARASARDRTFVVVQGFRSWVELFEMQRFQLIARELSARLVVVEVPGFGVAGSRLSSAERRALLGGNFGPLAERMFAAADWVLTGDDWGPTSFLGYSMGASIVGAMAKAVTKAVTVDEVVLVEPVALSRWRLRDLIAATRREDRWIADYVATNDAVDGAAPPWDQRPGVRPATRRPVDLLLLGGALRHGILRRDLLSAAGRLARVVVVRGDSSALSEAAYFPILTVLRQHGVAADELIVPGHHAFWHSLAAVADMTNALRKLLDMSR